MNNYNILLVDDEKTTIESYKDALEEKGYSVDIAENGKVALQCWNEKLYDLLIVDLKMPEMKCGWPPRFADITLFPFLTIDSASEAWNWCMSEMTEPSVNPDWIAIKGKWKEFLRQIRKLPMDVILTARCPVRTTQVVHLLNFRAFFKKVALI